MKHHQSTIGSRPLEHVFAQPSQPRIWTRWQRTSSRNLIICPTKTAQRRFCCFAKLATEQAYTSKAMPYGGFLSAVAKTRGGAAIALNRYDDARESLRMVTHSNPGDVAAHLALARCDHQLSCARRICRSAALPLTAATAEKKPSAADIPAHRPACFIYAS